MGRDMGTGAGKRAAAQAARWLARLDSNACSRAELEVFGRWLGANPLHEVAFRQAQAVWRESGVVIRGSVALERFARQALHDPVMSRPLSRDRTAAWLAIAAMVALVAIGAIIYYQTLPPPPGTRYATVVGEQRDVRLSDGSVLTLDTQSVIVERYSVGERRVDLRQGQVQFDVQGDSRRPFVVHAGAGTITAVGTRFQVRVAAARTAVTLLHGAVHVIAHDDEGTRRVRTLQPGQRVRLDADGRLGDVEMADLRMADGWTQGKLYVDDWALQDFVAELNRYSMVKLRIEDPAVRNIRLSGVFQTRDRRDLERLLEQGWGIRSRRIAENEILLTRR